MRTASISSARLSDDLPDRPTAQNRPLTVLPAGPFTERPQLRPSRQIQRAYVRHRFIAGWGSINPEVARAVRRHRDRTGDGRAPAPLSALRLLLTAIVLAIITACGNQSTTAPWAAILPSRPTASVALFPGTTIGFGDRAPFAVTAGWRRSAR